MEPLPKKDSPIKSETVFKNSSQETKQAIYAEERKVKRIRNIIEKERHWEKIENDLDKILHIIQEEAILQNPQIKNFAGPVSIRLKNTTPTGIFYLEASEPLPILQEKQISIYKQNNGYQVELDFELLSINEKLITCKPILLKKGENLRRNERIKTDKDIVSASHFLVSKVDRNLDSYLGYSTEVIFSEINQECLGEYPLLRLFYTYKKFDKFPEEVVFLREEGKPIFLANTLKMENAVGDYVDIIECYEDEDILEERKTKFFKEKISSFIYYPIYFRLLQEEIFIGYGYLPAISPNQLDDKVISMFQKLETKVTQTILDSHAVMIEERQHIVNYSESGILFETKNEDLAQGMIVKPTFSVDISFKLQSPLRLALIARNIYKIEDSYFIGSEIVGATNDPAGLDKYRNSIAQRK